MTIEPEEVPSAHVRLAIEARVVAQALSTLLDAWEKVSRVDPDIDVELERGYPFGADLQEVVPAAHEWARSVAAVVLSLGYENAQQRKGETR